jgi:thiamine kinase-like enzyme
VSKSASVVQNPLLAGALSSVIANCPELCGLSAASAVPLPGRSNLNYRLDAPAGRFVLRIPHPRAGPFVERASEAAAARMASRIGIGPPLVCAQANGLMLARWIDGRAMSAEAFISDPTAIGRVGKTLSRLHQSEEALEYRFDIFGILDAYAHSVRQRTDAAIPFSSCLRETVEAARILLGGKAATLVPSHCDLVPENCLDTGERMLLVDWEYAGMNDRAWDLAYLSLEASFAPQQEDILLAAYGSRAPSAGRLQMFKLLAAVLNFLWALAALPNEHFPHVDRWMKAELSAAEALARNERLVSWLSASAE